MELSTTECNLCLDGMIDLTEEYFEMHEIPVSVEWFDEYQGDDSWAYVMITPVWMRDE